jgi:hypothetical protein
MLVVDIPLRIFPALGTGGFTTPGNLEDNRSSLEKIEEKVIYLPRKMLNF